MAKPNQYDFDYKELATLMVKAADLHEGFWGLRMEFGLKGMNVNLEEQTLMPAALLLVPKIGLQRFESETNLSVDAAKVNPPEEASEA